MVLYGIDALNRILSFIKLGQGVVEGGGGSNQGGGLDYFVFDVLIVMYVKKARF